MTSLVVLSDTNAAVVLDGNGQFLFVGPQGALYNLDWTVVVQAPDTLVDNRGRISHINGTAIAVESGSATVYNDGSISSFFTTAILNSGGLLDLVNVGTILGGSAAGAGVMYNGGGSFLNLGVVSAGIGVAILGAALTSFVNEGSIYGGISSDTPIIGGLINHGRIASASGRPGDQAIGLYGPIGQQIVNSGDIVGNVYFGSGNDRYDGRGGASDGFVIGFLGNDTLLGGAQADSLRGDEDADLLQGNGGNDLLLGGAGNDILAGGAGTDTLNGGDGNDVLRGGGGLDFLNGGAGRDLLDYALSVTVNVNFGTGTATGGDAAGDTISGFENLAGGSGSDTLTGDAVGNVLYGRAGSDLLRGGGGNDHLVGDPGDDTLDGGLGVDVLRGGDGADVFRLAATRHSPNVAAGRDRIVDFVRTDGDRVDVSLIDANTALIGDQAFAFVGDAPFTAAGQLRAVVSGSGFLILGNTDADTATAEFALVMTSATTPIVTDFIL